ncbi:transposase [Sphingopyxis sp.]|uniref:transposase n=1 Tax=Sphingopyxis sp. TaxID=1908224 RepID=UPI0025D18F92|nr:transposase [Sphingopyxis sp.]MBR2173674.1 transposase [Sphingopyxis sp.]
MADRVSISFKLGGTLSADTWLELASVIASEGLSIEWYGPAFEPDADAIRADLAARKIEAVIPGRSNRRVKIEHDRTLYKQRNRIERVFGHLKINCAIATRYDQLANSFLGMVHIATARCWLKFVHAA